ncbi:hypothetical protein MG293_000603 [Ovis ammon polii]|uniref:Uncharacterized protein n=1 Tax=Ovis ammon polii TaxID=230172 RepID=A0AAD4UL33_OVIAM|nr:hypothetical protein MG293_000603 [Ovis ammon polii]
MPVLPSSSQYLFGTEEVYRDFLGECLQRTLSVAKKRENEKDEDTEVQGDQGASSKSSSQEVDEHSVTPDLSAVKAQIHMLNPNPQGDGIRSSRGGDEDEEERDEGKTQADSKKGEKRKRRRGKRKSRTRLKYLSGSSSSSRVVNMAVRLAVAACFSFVTLALLQVTRLKEVLYFLKAEMWLIQSITLVPSARNEWMDVDSTGLPAQRCPQPADGPEGDSGSETWKITSELSRHRVLVLDGPFKFTAHSILKTDGKPEAHAKRSSFPKATGRNVCPPSTTVILLYQSAIYDKVLVI